MTGWPLMRWYAPYIIRKGRTNMTQADAAKLMALVEDQYGRDAGRLVVLGRGDEYAVYIKQPGYFLWDWQSWTAYRRLEKQKAKRGRPRRSEEVLHAIDYSEAFAL